MIDLVPKLKQLFRANWPLFVIILAVSAFFWKVIFRGMVPLPADFVVGVYYPWLDYKWGYVTSYYRRCLFHLPNANTSY